MKTILLAGTFGGLLLVAAAAHAAGTPSTPSAPAKPPLTIREVKILPANQASQEGAFLIVNPAGNPLQAQIKISSAPGEKPGEFKERVGQLIRALPGDTKARERTTIGDRVHNHTRALQWVGAQENENRQKPEFRRHTTVELTAPQSEDADLGSYLTRVQKAAQKAATNPWKAGAHEAPAGASPLVKAQVEERNATEIVETFRDKNGDLTFPRSQPDREQLAGALLRQARGYAALAAEHEKQGGKEGLRSAEFYYDKARWTYDSTLRAYRKAGLDAEAPGDNLLATFHAVSSKAINMAADRSSRDRANSPHVRSYSRPR